IEDLCFLPILSFFSAQHQMRRANSSASRFCCWVTGGRNFSTWDRMKSNRFTPVSLPAWTRFLRALARQAASKAGVLVLGRQSGMVTFQSAVSSQQYAVWPVLRTCYRLLTAHCGSSLRAAVSRQFSKSLTDIYLQVSLFLSISQARSLVKENSLGFFFSAPKGRKTVAQGASPGTRCPKNTKQ